MAHVIKVVTDSTCDLPREWVEQWDITVIPTLLQIDGQSLLDDGVQISREEYYRRLPAMKQLPTTSACPLGLSRDLIARAKAGADHLILLTPPASLSAIHNNFRLAADEMAPGAYTLIDSGQTSMGLGWIALGAAQAARTGASLETIRQRIDSLKRRTHVYAALSTLENLRRSGRVNWLIAMAGTLLQIKPLIRLYQGDVSLVERIRTFRRATERLIQLGKAHAPLERLAVLHTNNLEDAHVVLNALSAVFPPEQVVIRNVNPVLGTHVGASGVGIALVTQV